MTVRPRWSLGAGAGGGPRVRVLDLTTGRPIRGPRGDFFAVDPGRRSGVAVGADALAGDVNADGTPDLVTGSGAGEASRVVVYSGADGSVLSDFSPFGPEVTAGVRVATAYVTDDAAADVVVATGPGVESRVRVFDGATGQLVSGPVGDFAPFGAGYTGGTSIAASNDPPGDVVFSGSSTDYHGAHVDLTVTVQSDGNFRWDYLVTNDAFWGGTEIRYFGVYFSGPDPVGVTGAANNLLWYDPPDGAWSSVDWSMIPGDPSVPIAPGGGTGKFSFTTSPRPVVAAGISLDDSGDFPFAGPGPEPQVIITDSKGNIVTADSETGLKVAKWQDAFKLTADGKSVEIKGPDAGTNWDFIDRDPDRFNVLVYDKQAWDAETERVQVLISTENAAGFTAYDDAATAVDLVRYTDTVQGKTGWYWSDSQMLVSNDADDDYKAEQSQLGLGYLREDDQDPAGFALPKNGYQWLESDRTHRIALGGTVKAEYTSAQGVAAKPAEAPVKIAKTVKVHVTILKNGGAEVISKADAEKYVKGANEQYAQVGIRLDVNVSDPVNPPQGVVLTDGLSQYSWPDGGSMSMTLEEEALLGHAAFRTETTDDIEVYYINFFVDNGRYGESFPASGTPHPTYWESAIVTSPNTKPFQWPQVVVAHEIGHVLLNSGAHYNTGPTKTTNLMVEGPQGVQNPADPTGPQIDAVIAGKRLTQDQETVMLNWQPQY